MAFELDSHTFRYSISHSFVDYVQVDCVPLNRHDMTMSLRSAKLTLTGTLFELAIAPEEDNTKEQTAKSPEMTAEGIESLWSKMEQSDLPSKSSHTGG